MKKTLLLAASALLFCVSLPAQIPMPEGVRLSETALFRRDYPRVHPDGSAEFCVYVPTARHGIPAVYYESPGTLHEWQTWRRSL